MSYKWGNSHQLPQFNKGKWEETKAMKDIKMQNIIKFHISVDESSILPADAKKFRLMNLPYYRQTQKNFG